MRNESKHIALVTVCDNHFSVMLAALLKSIESNQDGSYLISIYVVDDGISSKNRRLLDSTIQAGNIHIKWIPIKAAVPESLRLPLDGSTFPLCIYARICIPYFLSEDIEKAIYLDADTIVACDIRALWEIDLAGYSLAAVTDRAKTIGTGWAGITNYKELGLSPNSPYFNTGVLVIDVKKWREERVPEQVFGCIEKNIQYANFPDQYGLNVYFANNWLILPAKWNSYAQDEIPEPYIIHFTGMKPIYRGYAFSSAYKYCFYKYLSLTPFRNFKPRRTYVRLLSKALHIIEKKWLMLCAGLRKTPGRQQPVI